MDKVLQVTSKLFRGGAEAFIMNVYRNMDRKRFQFDFLTFRSSREFYEDEIESLGGHIYHVPIMEGTNILRRRSMLDAFFDEHGDYAAVHCHMAALGGDCLASAERHGIGRRFSHSHIADFEHNPRGYLKHAFERGFGNCATVRFACSRQAGRYMYGDAPFTVVNNGIDTTSFAYDSTKRTTFRKSLGIEESDLLVGHVGRFEIMKNHAFLIEVFAMMVARGFSGRLVLAGDGSLRQEIEAQVEKASLSDRVIFLGTIENMPAFYSGIDLFVMPSLFEGLPFSAIEAQCSGLPCVLSDTISIECKITEGVHFIPLSSDKQIWVDVLSSALATRRIRTDSSIAVRNAGYDIGNVTKMLEMYYENEL